MARRMAELAMWNVYRWKPTKEAFGISETKVEEMLEKAKKVKKKEEKEREKEKEVKSGDRGGSWGQGGSWNGGENWRPSFRGQCYSCGMQGHSARYCRQGQVGSRGLQGNCCTRGVWDHSSRVCSSNPPRIPGGMGAGIFHQSQGFKEGWGGNSGDRQEHGQQMTEKQMGFVDNVWEE
jgi:hypothetical protein